MADGIKIRIFSPLDLTMFRKRGQKRGIQIVSMPDSKSVSAEIEAGIHNWVLLCVVPGWHPSKINYVIHHTECSKTQFSNIISISIESIKN